MSIDQVLAGALRGDLAPLERGVVDVAALVNAADEHGVAMLLWQAVGRSSAAAATVRACLDQRARGAATRDLLIRSEMRRVLDAIAAHGGRAVVFKGSALAYSLYAEPWHRPRTDTDLLTADAEVPLVSSALESCGYRRSNALTSGALVSHQVAFERTDAHGLHHIVDLHWKIVNPQALADALPFEEVWRDAVPAPALGPAARVPSLVASMVLGCVHRLAHHQGQDRLIWLHDLKLLSERFSVVDWRALQALVVERGVAGLCLDGLRQAREQLGAVLPADLEAALVAAAPSEASRTYLEGPVRKRDVLASDLAVLPTWGARLRLLKEHAFPPAAFIRQRYGVRNPLLLPALYAHRLVTGAFKWARH